MSIPLATWFAEEFGGAAKQRKVMAVSLIASNAVSAARPTLADDQAANPRELCLALHKVTDLYAGGTSVVWGMCAVAL